MRLQRVELKRVRGREVEPRHERLEAYDRKSRVVVRLNAQAVDRPADDPAWAVAYPSCY